MSKMRVIRDASGAIINIGPWDERRDVVEVLGDDGEVTGHQEVVTNPLPEGAYEDEAEIVEDADGGLRCASDYAGLRRTAYPNVADQLDALWKGGEAADAMRAAVLAVKAAYPKA